MEVTLDAYQNCVDTQPPCKLPDLGDTNNCTLKQISTKFI